MSEAERTVGELEDAIHDERVLLMKARLEAKEAERSRDEASVKAKQARIDLEGARTQLENAEKNGDPAKNESADEVGKTDALREKVLFLVTKEREAREKVNAAKSGFTAKFEKMNGLLRRLEGTRELKKDAETSADRLGAGEKTSPFIFS